MRRREYVGALGVACIGTLSGCSGDEMGDDAEAEGTIVVDEEAAGASKHTFDATADDVIHVHVESEGGDRTVVTVSGPESTLETVETADESGVSLPAQTTGRHTLRIQQPDSTGEVSVEVGIES